MLKSFYFLTILLFNLSSSAQDTIKKVVPAKKVMSGKHELKVGIIKPLAYQAIETTYEYIASNKFGFGTAVLFNTDKSNTYQEDFSVTPFARFYFQDPKMQYGNGLFLEGFGKYISGRYKGLNDIDIAYDVTAVGLGGGYKYLFKSGLLIEPVIGFSQAIARKDIASPGGGLRADLSVGYRF